MPVTRREFIAGVGAVAGLRLMAPVVARAGDGVGVAAAPAELRDINRVVVIFLVGGNDGLNTVVPVADVGSDKRYSVYQQVRPTLRIRPEETLRLDRPGDTGRAVGLHPRLETVHALYRQERLAIVQGVDYPNHNYSHFTSTDIWQSGRPEANRSSGWIGRHLDRVGIPDGALRGLAIATDLPLILRGERRSGVNVDAVRNVRFADGSSAAGPPRQAALLRYAAHPPAEALRRYAGERAAHAVELAAAAGQIPPPPATSNPLAAALLTARAFMERDHGVEIVSVTHRAAYDSHTSQARHHPAALAELDGAIEAFLFGTIGGVALPGVGPLPAAIADRTLIITTSEFGRRIGESGVGETAGTDHGAAGPLFLIGPPAGARAAGVRLAPGIHGDHPPMGSPLAPADNLAKTTELRAVYQAVLQQWLGDPDPAYEGRYEPLPGLLVPR